LTYSFLSSFLRGVLLLLIFAAPVRAAPVISTFVGGDWPLSMPMAVALDSAGNRYIASRFNGTVAKVDAASGAVSRIAGTGIAGYSGDGGLATDARLSSLVYALALDGAGNVYISDAANQVIRKVTVATGIISTVAGTVGSGGYSGDGGSATLAQINNPQGIALDAAGNLYIADAGNSAIRKVDAATGNISTLAGTGISSGFTGDGGPAGAAQLSGPAGVALDGAGNLYIADNGNQRIRMISAATGIISTIAGDGTRSFGGDGGPATAAMFNWPCCLAVDSAATKLYVADRGNNRIRVVNLGAGTIDTTAGNGLTTNSGDGGPATAATVNNPRGLALDAAANLYIAESGNSAVRKVTASSGLISTDVAWGGDQRAATLALLNRPGGVALDGAGNLYIADSNDHVIRKVAANGVISTVAGNAALGSGYSGDGGSATLAKLNAPNGVAVDSAGNLYIAECNNNVVRKVTAATGIISTFAGNNTAGVSGDGGAATAAQLNCPSGVAIGPGGSVYIADTGNNWVRKVNGSGNISVVAGSDQLYQGYAGDGGPAYQTGTWLNQPTGVWADASDNLYIADSQNNVIRKVTSTTGIISTVAGNNALGSGYGGDGGAASDAQLFLPQYVALGSDGSLYIADTANDVIRKVDGGTGKITTLAGNNALGGGYSGDGGDATAAQLGNPAGLAVDAAGSIYIADTRNSRIRKIAGSVPRSPDPVPSAPTESPVRPGGSVTLGSLPVVSYGGGTVIVPSDSCGGTLSLQLSAAGKAEVTYVVLGKQTVAAQPLGSSAGFVILSAYCQSVPIIKMSNGTASFTAPAEMAFLVLGGAKLVSGRQGATVATDGEKLVISSGSISLTTTDNTVAADAMITAYAGEVIEKDAQGKLSVRVGSLSGSDGAVGDLLKPANGLPAAVKLIGKLGRLGDTTPLDMLAAAYGQASVRQNSDGTLGPTIHAVPVLIRIDTNRADGVQGIEVARNGLVVRLLPLVAEVGAFTAQVDRISGYAGTTLSLDSAGILNITSGAKQYVGRAALPATPDGGADGFTADAQGNLVWTNNGTAQVVYPAFRYLDKVNAALLAIDPKATLSDNGDGSYAIILNGRRYQLRPRYEILNLFTFPAAHRNDPWWLEDATVFVNYGNVTAQGFTVR